LRTGRTAGPKLVVLAAILILSLALSSTVHVATAAPAGKYFDHLVTIVMENQDQDSVLSDGHYQSSLAANYSLATGYSAIAHPSEPNYCVMLGASTSGCSDNGACCNTGPNLIDRFEPAGITWKAFAEDADGSGTCSFNPPRGGDHFPFLLYTSINNNAGRCANMVTTSSPRDPEFIASLSDPASAPSFIWLTPNDNDNSHDTSIGTGDHFLARLVPGILASPVFKNTRAALFIVYDEGNDQTCHSGGPDCVYASWSGPVAAKAFNSTKSYDHYSYVHTIEDNWGLQPLNSNDAKAALMSEFFTGSSFFTGTGQWLTLVILAAVVSAAVLIGWKIIPSKTRRHARRSPRKHVSPVSSV